MMKKNLKYLLALLCIIVLLLCTGCSSNNAAPQPISITVWTYYNGTLLESFNTLVKTFNETVGKEKGIVVEAYSQGSVNELEASVMQSAEGKVGAAAMPNIFSAYADTAYALDKLGLVVDVSSYLTADERAAYVDNYLTEGDFGQTGSIKIFPVAKSTELLFLNETDWQPFAEATGTQESEMRTIEGLLAVAERYYNWTDAQTATPDDGKALFGSDAMANYLLIGAQELGCTIFEVDGDGRLTLHFDRDIIRKLWDSYYVPFIKGYFSAAGRFRSDDIKTGNLLCYVGSSSSGTFFPSRVITSDTESHDITLELKLLADVGLVGFPNVGKSTLLSVVSKAHPKIANYHFTTLFPNLGVVYVDEGVSFVMADIPGIIEGASEGAGLGHDFLRHIDRCRLLIHLVDVSGSEGRDPVEDFDAINAELREYNPELAERPQIVAANKCDLLGDDRENIDRLRARAEERGYEFFEMSAVTHEGTRELIKECARRLAELPPIASYEADYVPPEPVIDTSEKLEIRQFDDMWIVEGPWLQRLVATINFGDYESRMYFDKVLREAGVFERMEKMGVRDGDTVSMYDLMFEYKD